jgi:hypothetical protein
VLGQGQQRPLGVLRIRTHGGRGGGGRRRW